MPGLREAPSDDRGHAGFREGARQGRGGRQCSKRDSVIAPQGSVDGHQAKGTAGTITVEWTVGHSRSTRPVGSGWLCPDAHDPGFVGEDDCLYPVAQVQFVEDVRDVGLGGVLRKDEFGRDLRVR
jgi:hypothetical protein